jgi:large subunit ribosomal protein L10
VALSREEKEKIVTDLQGQLAHIKAAVVTHYRGLTVEKMEAFRQKLREEKISYHVVKNTLIKKASQGTPLEKLAPYFEGPMAIAMTEGDPVALAKVVTEFLKTPSPLEVRIGLVEGELIPAEGLKSLASLPSREVLLAQVMGGIQMPGGMLAGGIMGMLQELLWTLQARVDQLAAAEPVGT